MASMMGRDMTPSRTIRMSRTLIVWTPSRAHDQPAGSYMDRIDLRRFCRCTLARRRGNMPLGSSRERPRQRSGSLGKNRQDAGTWQTPKGRPQRPDDKNKGRSPMERPRTARTKKSGATIEGRPRIRAGRWPLRIVWSCACCQSPQHYPRSPWAAPAVNFSNPANDHFYHVGNMVAGGQNKFVS